jgi:nitroimidazol reductase NimA-like FMN-containing flavoprotein (pyridoxamine 5'-phosphate oxidase superfamily)
VTERVERDAELFALDEVMCRMLLRAQPVGRLVLAGPTPHVLPVNFRVADDTVWFRTVADGAAAGAAGELVAFEVDMFDDRTSSGWSVVVRGHLDLADDAAPDVAPWAPGDRHQAMRIRIESVTGRLLRGAVPATPSVAGYL